jgi:hypothetical protein
MKLKVIFHIEQFEKSKTIILITTVKIIKTLHFAIQK